MKRLLASEQTGRYSEEERQAILDELNAFAHGRVAKFKKFEKYGLYFEKHSIENIIREYIRWFNESVRDYGSGFASDWDSDTVIIIRYKNGKIRYISENDEDGSRRISTDGIDSVIVDGSWGTAFAGPGIVFRDETCYDDLLDIRADFSD